MKKYKLLRFGRCYINRRGEFVIAVLNGSKKKGYKMIASHRNVPWLGRIQLLSRAVPNDGNWIEITPEMYNVASSFHVKGKVCPLKSLGLKKYEI